MIRFFTNVKPENVFKNRNTIKNIEENEIKFNQGFILDESLYIYDIEDRPNFKRGIFEIGIPFQVKTQKIVYNGLISNIKQDIIFSIPDCQRNKFDFKLRIKTRSRVLGDIIEEGNKSYFTLETYIIISVVSKVQLLIPYLGYCAKPTICLNFEDDICEEFYNRPFPQFYPPQYKEGIIWFRKDIKVRKVNDAIVHGKIYRQNNQEPVQRAIIAAFYMDDETGNLKNICHTYSDINGYYMLNIPPQFEGKTIILMASKGSYDISIGH